MWPPHSKKNKTSRCLNTWGNLPVINGPFSGGENVRPAHRLSDLSWCTLVWMINVFNPMYFYSQLLECDFLAVGVNLTDVKVLVMGPVLLFIMC